MPNNDRIIRLTSKKIIKFEYPNLEITAEDR